VTTGQKNAIVMGVVAITVAAMLYTGAYQSHRTRAANGGLQGNVVGKTAPDFELETLDGKKVKLSDYRGKAVLLNFWATWCQPCKIEMPWLIEFQKNYRDQGFEIVGVAMEDTEKPEIEKFLKEMGVNYVVLLGKESVGEQYGGVLGHVGEQYGGVLGLPTTFYIGRDGTIVEQHAGLISKGDIENHIKKALATGPGKP
jgi:cytochrome c biogenesis protein CcmG/thiol:disulfide interchange protein DsbE